MYQTEITEDKITMSIAICDDDKEYVKRIRYYLERILAIDDVEASIDEYYSGKEMAAAEQVPDIVFLDIEMDVNGIIVAHKLKKRNEDIFIILLTQYPQYSIAGYKVNAHRYILKQSNNFEKEISEVFSSYRTFLNKQRKIVIMTSDDGSRGVAVRTYKEIVYIETENKGRKTKIHCTSGEWFTSTTNIKAFTGLLGSAFFLTHRAYLVNLEHVVRYETDMIFMDNGDVLPLTRQRKPEFEARYIEYNFEMGCG